MKTCLHVLPEREMSAAVNMAEDELLLNYYPDENAVIFRHFFWEHRAITFGYSQSYEWVLGHVPEINIEAVRRATGGGIVDHRNDWTYSLIIPSSHPMHRAPADHIYKVVHDSISCALSARGQPAEVMPCNIQNNCGVPSPIIDKAAATPSLCFIKPETYDTLDPRNGRKLAGAAMKRTRRGLLLQGSIDKEACAEIKKWNLFGAKYIRELATAFGVRTIHANWPNIPENTYAEVTLKYSSADWNKRR